MMGRIWCLLAGLCLTACAQQQGGGQPVGPARAGAADAGRRDEAAATVFSYVDKHGRVRMVSAVDEVPEAYRDQVVATDTSRDRRRRIADDRVVVLDLRQQKDGAPLNYSLVDLAALTRPAVAGATVDDPGDLGRQVVGQAASGVRQMLGIEAAGPARPAVILYSAPWCGFCKKAAAYLRQKGVPFEERDIEASRAAAVELERKMSAAGLRGGGIPVLDIGGTLVIGFDRQRIDGLLKLP